MKPHLFLILTAGLLLGADDPKKTAGQLQGTWKVVSQEVDGKPRAAADITDLTVTFGKDKYSLKGTGFTGSTGGSYTLDAGKKPAVIDIVPADGPNKGKKIHGIVEVDGDNLKTCYDMAGKGRPTAFASKPGSGYVYTVYKRVRP